MTRFTLLNDALARGQLAGGRAAKAGLPRMVPAGLYARYLGVHAADADVAAQFQRGFALGYDTSTARTGDEYGTPWSDDMDLDLGDSFSKIASKAAQAAKKGASDSGPGADRPDLSWPAQPAPGPAKPGVYTPPTPSKPIPVVYSPPKPSAPAAPKPPAPKPATQAGLFGLSRNATIALGVGTALAIAGGIYFGTKE